MAKHAKTGRIRTLMREKAKGMTAQEIADHLELDADYFWQPMDTCPRGVKVQLLGRGGVALYGQFNGKDNFYTHWAPLPKLRKEKV